MGLLIWALYKCSEQSIIAQTLFMPHFKEGRVIVDAWLQHPWIVQNRSTEGDHSINCLTIWIYEERERECKFPLNVLLTHPSHRQIHGLFTTSRLHVLRNLKFCWGIDISQLGVLSLCFPKDCILSNMIVEGIYVFTSYFVFFFKCF